MSKLIVKKFSQQFIVSIHTDIGPFNTYGEQDVRPGQHHADTELTYEEIAKLGEGTFDISLQPAKKAGMVEMTIKGKNEVKKELHPKSWMNWPKPMKNVAPAKPQEDT